MRDGCTELCKEKCARPDDCWQIGPEVYEGNEQAWSLYRLFETRWDRGASGYRTNYNSSSLERMAVQVGVRGNAFLDLMERVKVIEIAVLEIECQRPPIDEARRKADEAAKKITIGR